METPWIEWTGGQKRPVHGNVRVDVKFRDGQVVLDVASLWQNYWTYDGVEPDKQIVAYRKSTTKRHMYQNTK
jgi:hypothetical protein